MNEELHNFIESANVMAEMLYVHHKAFENAGFDEEQALYLTGEMLKTMLERGLT